MKKPTSYSRRNLLKTAAGITILTSLGTAKAVANFVKTDNEETAGKEKGRTLRFAHFTDIHIEPQRGAPKGLTQALQHMQRLPDKPQLLIVGGDQVFDSFSADDNWATIQFNLFKKVMRKECKIPVKYCIGNHDVWGWDKKSSRTTGNEPNWGKKRAVDEFSMPGRYYSFDYGKWHIIILDSTHTADNNYLARLDDEQFKWLRKDLQNNKDKFIMIVSHIPILSAAAFLDGDNEKSGHWSIPKEWMHIDARGLKDLFSKYLNVKLCVSGHLHLVDGVEYNNVTYICGGAVCGAWWRGNHMECDEGYGIFDIYDDGSFDYRYVSYNWVPVKG